MMAANQRPSVGVHASDALVPRTEQPGIGRPTPAITTAATTVTAQYHRASWHRSCVHDHFKRRATQHGDLTRHAGGGRAVYGGGRGAGRGGVPGAADVGAGAAHGHSSAYQPEHQQLHAAAPNFQPDTSPPSARGPWTPSTATSPTTHRVTVAPGGTKEVTVLRPTPFATTVGSGGIARCCLSRQNPAEHRFQDRAFYVQNRYTWLPLLRSTPFTEGFP